jgi:hypothetical protein
MSQANTNFRTHGGPRSEPVDPAADFSAVTGDKEPVTLLRLDRDTGDTLLTASNVDANRLRPSLRTEGAPDGGGVPVTRLTWHVRGDAAFGDGTGLRKADVIQDAAGAKWVVDSVGEPKAGEPFVCETVLFVGG